MRDNLFSSVSGEEFGYESFSFDARVCSVFDDMVERSVPGYATIQLLLGDLAGRYGQDARIYDLGCSTGNTLLAIASRSKATHFEFIGIDESQDMLDLCKAKLDSKEINATLVNADLTDPNIFSQGPAHVIILNLVLQFIRPAQRKALIQRAFDNLIPGGCLLLVEKTIQADPKLNQMFIDYYHSYKAEMGYSQISISRKREALENRLIPYFREENLNLLTESGFRYASTFFQWINFEGYIAIKENGS